MLFPLLDTITDIHLFQEFHAYKHNLGDPISDWKHADLKDQFDEYRVNMPYVGQLPTPTSIHPIPPNSSYSMDPVSLLKMGIKCDPSIFPILKDKKQANDWKLSMMLNADAQDIANVLDPTCSPSTAEEQALFAKQQKYFMAIFNHTLQTDKGKAIVCQHSAVSSAQMVFDNMCKHLEKSTKSAISSSDLLSYITMEKYLIDTWNGSSEQFILHWQDLVHQFNKLASPVEHLTDTLQKLLLEMVVHGNETPPDLSHCRPTGCCLWQGSVI
jgi:hypothetical protein